jgi:hypothetical protein
MIFASSFSFSVYIIFAFVPNEVNMYTFFLNHEYWHKVIELLLKGV